MGTVRSKDGTTIAFDEQGDGPALILVAGAMGTRLSGSKPAHAMLLAQPSRSTAMTAADGETVGT